MKKHIDIVRGLVERIEANLFDEIQIVSLAKSFELSPWHFQRLFKGVVGDSLGGYIRGRRLSRAAEMLLGTKLGIIDIALEVGFTSHEAFTRAFKNQFGMTPKDFRVRKPSVMIHQKPLLTSELLAHVLSGISREPQIIERPAQYLIGFAAEIPSPFAIDAGHCEVMATPWLMLVDRQYEIRNREPETFCGLFLSSSGDFTEERQLYMVGVPVASLDHVPDGMIAHTIPAQTVAVFDRHVQVQVDTVRQTVDAIYGFWLPNSSFERGAGHDYELFYGSLERPIPKLHTMKYAVPVVPEQCKSHA